MNSLRTNDNNELPDKEDYHTPAKISHTHMLWHPLPSPSQSRQDSILLKYHSLGD